MATDLQGLERMKSNYIRIGVMVTQIISAPNRDAIDDIIEAADGAGIPRPKPTYSKDGISYDWTGYQSMILQAIKDLKELIVAESGPYEVRTLGRV